MISKKDYYLGKTFLTSEDYVVKVIEYFNNTKAAELLSMAFFGEEHKDLVRVNEIKVYYSKGAWCDRMDGIEPTEPCVYLHNEIESGSKPFRVI